MDFEEKMKVLQALGIQNKNLTVILEQNNEHNIENVEAGGIGIQINNGVQTVNNDKKKPSGNKLWFDVGNERYTTHSCIVTDHCMLWFDVGNERYTTGTPAI